LDWSRPLHRVSSRLTSHLWLSLARQLSYLAATCDSKLSSGNQTGRVLFPPFSFVTGRVAPTRVTRAGLPMTEAAEKLAPVFLKHGYAFMYLYCRGQGLSADQATFIQDILQREEASKGKEARQHLQFVLATTDQLDDVMAALSFLKTAPAVDAKCIAIKAIPSAAN